MSKEKFEYTISALDQLFDLAKYMLKNPCTHTTVTDLEEAKAFFSEEKAMYGFYLKRFKSGDVTDMDIANLIEIFAYNIDLSLQEVNDGFKDKDFDFLECGAYTLWNMTTGYNELLKEQKNRAN